MVDPRSQLEAMYQAAAAAREVLNDEPLDIDAVIIGWSFAHPTAPASSDMDGLKSLALYCQSKGKLSASLVTSDWGRNHGYSRTVSGQYLAALVSCDLVELEGDRVVWIGD